MADSLATLELVTKPSESQKTEFDWGQLLGAMQTAMTSPLTPASEEVLVKILRMEGPILLSASSEVPHAMSADEMLKSLAVQFLVKHTGATYLWEMKKVAALAKSPALAGMVRSAIAEALPAAEPRVDKIRVTQMGSGMRIIKEKIGTKSVKIPDKTLILEGGRFYLANQRIRRPSYGSTQQMHLVR